MQGDEHSFIHSWTARLCDFLLACLVHPNNTQHTQQQQQTRAWTHQGELSDILDVVAASHDEGGHSGGGQGGGDSETTLALVHTALPAAPLASGSKHATTTAHVAKGTLAGTVGTATSDTGDTRHGAASAPRLSRGLVRVCDTGLLPGQLLPSAGRGSCMLHAKPKAVIVLYNVYLVAGLKGDSVCLTLVLGDVRVHEGHHIVADGGREHCWQSDGLALRARLGVKDADNGTCSSLLTNKTPTSARAHTQARTTNKSASMSSQGREGKKEGKARLLHGVGHGVAAHACSGTATKSTAKQQPPQQQQQQQ